MNAILALRLGHSSTRFASSIRMKRRSRITTAGSMNYELNGRQYLPTISSRLFSAASVAGTVKRSSGDVKGNRPSVVKPVMSIEETYFDFASSEGAIYNWWENKGYFKPKNDKDHNSNTNSSGRNSSASAAEDQKSFVINMPPPNVTGYLHMGHALFLALQDLMIRFNRMKGIPSLWVPGT